MAKPSKPKPASTPKPPDPEKPTTMINPNTLTHGADRETFSTKEGQQGTEKR